ncbi:response regulator transcription factor [Methylobacillus flagellatus]|uniref:response regulator transcription factor n=1 Tax=Methylobacillus flagellatus TaxID=405 RepID=UPI002853C536|nr:response regulator transcription factor [Methylobacillus flagellatus]MDR5172196.1 response regulator transcription factor [Methylobacillus flagellatus]
MNGFYTELNNSSHLRVIIVEDDQDLREETELGLRSLGIETTGVADAAALYRELITKPYDIAILDIGLPGEDGLSVLKHLRSSNKMGIVMLTARGALDDRVQGLNDGADAYMVKPVDLKELASVLCSLARRLESMRVERRKQPQPLPAVQTAPSWKLCKTHWTLISPEDISIPLTPKEYTFLSRLVEKCGQPVPRAHIVHAFGGTVDDFDFHRVEVMISRLRRKGKAITGELLPIKALPGFGFSFTADCILT